MALRKVAWNTEKNGVKYSGEVEYEMPEGLEAKVQKFGEEAIELGFIKSADIYIQAFCRRMATREEDPMTPAEIAKAAPGIRITFSQRETVDPVDRILAQYGKLNPEQRAALVASLEETLA